jgi:hypothetical protein
VRALVISDTHFGAWTGEIHPLNGGPGIVEA